MKKIKHLIKKYFFPHEGNSYKPHFLRSETVMFLFGLIIVVELGMLVQVFLVFDKTNFLASVLPGVLTTLTNKERAQNDAPPLQENSLLDIAAQLKAEDMASLGYFAHNSPEGKTPWYWFQQVGYKYQYAGENLAVNFFDSEDVAKAWMASPTHRANIVKPEYTEIGIGVANGIYQGRNTVFVAQLFGKPVSAAVTPTPQPQSQPRADQPPAEKPTPTPAETKPVTPTPKPKPAPTPIEKPTQPPAQTPQPKADQPPAEAPNQVAIAPTNVEVLGEEATTVATVSTLARGQSAASSLIKRVLSSPRENVNIIYGALGALVFISLLLMLFIQSELRHPAMLARGVSLVVVIFALAYINLNVFASQTEVPTSGLSASVIETLE